MPRGLGAREQALECLDAQDLGQLRQRRPRRQVQIQRLPPERLGREKAPATGHLVPGTPGAVAVNQQMGQGAANLVGAQVVGGALGARRSARHSSDRGSLGRGGQPFALPLGDPLGTSRGHSRSFAACGGSSVCGCGSKRWLVPSLSSACGRAQAKKSGAPWCRSPWWPRDRSPWGG